MLGDISKETLYEGVKYLIDQESNPHLHLAQHKLYTLFSIAFQYLLFKSTKEPGSYIVRIEDSHLAEKLVKRSKDQSTRRFLQSMLLPRRFKYGKSTFYLDFFHIGTWNMTKDIPTEKLMGAIIVKNTGTTPSAVVIEEEEDPLLASLPKDYYISSLLDVAKRTLTIAFENDFENLTKVYFPFIKKEATKTLSGVTLSPELDWDNLD